PCALFNDRTSPECNLDIPIWKLLRASTAAPVYFPPETITLGKQTHSFIDGGITPYNNPSLIAFLTATLPEYKIDWKPGEKNLLLVSVGTGLNRARFAPRGLIPSVLAQLAHLPPAMIHGAMQQQDVMCRILGKCVAGDALDMELGELRNDLRLMGEPMFRYARFNRQSKDSVKMDAVHRMQELLDSGRAFAKETVRVGDLFE
ncbi:MAG TPA: hypothetical protein PK402_12550, partial [Tepidisphaeraceae bacterium]|nr:hypothetical protein [Tepidisphaeraceae bacterium]